MAFTHLGSLALKVDVGGSPDLLKTAFTHHAGFTLKADVGGSPAENGLY